MRWMVSVVIGALISLSSPGFARDTTPETPQDYAWGRALTTTESSPWYRVDLPVEVYQQSVWPDLRDVRIFNHQGERVPFTLETLKETQPAPKSMALRIFPLSTSPVEKLDEQGQRIWLRSPDGYQIKLEGSRIQGVGQSYLLALPDDASGVFTVSQLKINWDKPATNWQGKATVYYSTDMQEWGLLQDDVPVMDVASGNDRLTLNQININLAMTTDGPRYLLVVFNTTQLPVTITGATVIENSDKDLAANVSLPAWGNRISTQEAQYQWSQPQPLSSIAVKLDEEGVLPVEIAWRPSAESEWRPLAKEVLWQLNGQVSDDIASPGELVQGIRLKAVNAHMPEAIPQVTGQRTGQRLLFNAQGTGPFILAWGNKAAGKEAVTLDNLIPAALRQQHSPDNLPEAVASDRVKLGGEARLSATSAAELRSQWQIWLVWAALVLGVLALLWMALRIWREVQKERSA